MFISIKDRGTGERTLSTDMQIEPAKPWVLLLQVRETSNTCKPHGMNCMEDEHFTGLAQVLQESFLVLKEKFLQAVATKKPQALKVGKEADIRIYAQVVQEIVCTCAFSVTAVRSL